MKFFFTLLVCSLSCIYASAQNEKLEVVCEVYFNRINYGGIETVLPDSLKRYFIKLDKKPRLTNLAIVNFLCLTGWSLINYGDRKDISSSAPAYLLKRELLVSENDYKIIRKLLSEWIEK